MDITNRMADLGYTNHYFDLLCGLMVGASILARLLLEQKSNFQIPALKKVWGKGDRKKATRLIEICSYPMLSILYRKLKEQGKEVKQSEINNMINKIQSLFGSDFQADVNTFLKLDKQYNFERDEFIKKEKTGGFYQGGFVILLMSKVGTALGLMDYIDWEKTKIPVCAHNDIVLLDKIEMYYPFDADVEINLHIDYSIAIAGASMLKTYKVAQSL